jgi:photosystem II stability/assembly factor-like uncharacterized protein
MANRSRSVWLSRFRKLAPLGLWMLLLAVCSCGDQTTTMVPTEGPLVRIHVGPVPSGTVEAVLTVTAQDPTMMEKIGSKSFKEAPFDLLGVSFPVGTRGTTTFKVDLKGAADCLLATGTATLTIDSDGVLELTVNVTPVQFCGNGVTLTVQVANIAGARGIVQSTPSGISCDGGGNGCTVTVQKGTMFSLAATEINGTFNGWSGGGCPSSGLTCAVTLNQDTVVQAVFTLCRGWCKDMPPTGVTANLNAVGGTVTSNVIAAGDNGVALAWDGAAWKTASTNKTGALRGVAGRLGGSAVYVVGDGGTILKWTGSGSAGSFGSITSGTTDNLNGVVIAPDQNGYIVGSGGRAFVVATNGMVTSKLLLLGNNLLSISALANSDVLIGGSKIVNSAYAVIWDGANMTPPQMATGTSINGNISAVLAGTTYHYAAGDGGMIVRRAAAKGNDNTWTQVAMGLTTNTIRALWSSGDNFIIAVGDNGTILTSDGNTWTKMTSTVSVHLRGVWGTGPTNIFAVGDSATILRYTP